jgi:hypothetical protein
VQKFNNVKEETLSSLNSSADNNYCSVSGDDLQDLRFSLKHIFKHIA